VRLSTFSTYQVWTGWLETKPGMEMAIDGSAGSAVSRGYHTNTPGGRNMRQTPCPAPDLSLFLSFFFKGVLQVAS